LSAARPIGLRLIAAFKFVKAVALGVAGVGASRLTSPERAAWLQDWLEALSLRLDHRLVAGLAGKAAAVLELTTRQRFVGIAATAFVFASLYVVEGVGLALARRWAEYLTVAVTISFLPIEVVAAWHDRTLPRLAIIGLNAAVVTYLVRQLWFGRSRSASTESENRLV
jgi:uncharacterized membrane protein (DUF2068 family)